MKLVKSTLGVFGLAAALLLASPTYAKGSVSINVPGFNYGYYDKQHNRHSYSKRYRNDRGYKQRSYHHDRYDRYRNDDYRDYSEHGYQNRYAYKHRYSKPYQHSYPQAYTVCPDPGYSRYRIQRSYCYPHKDHFHCE
jgi:hypothetical protein